MTHRSTSVTCDRWSQPWRAVGGAARQWAGPAVAGAGLGPAPGAYPAAGTSPPGSPPPLRQHLVCPRATDGQERVAAAAAVAAGRGGPHRPPAAVCLHPRRPGAAHPQGACSGTQRVPGSSGPGPGAGGEAPNPRRARLCPSGCPRPPHALRSQLGEVESRPACWAPSRQGGVPATCVPLPSLSTGASGATLGWRQKSRELLRSQSLSRVRPRGCLSALAGPARSPASHWLGFKPDRIQGPGAPLHLPVVQTVQALPLRENWPGG